MTTFTFRPTDEDVAEIDVRSNGNVGGFDVRYVVAVAEADFATVGFYDGTEHVPSLVAASRFIASLDGEVTLTLDEATGTATIQPTERSTA